jgi:hypothetical protein
MPHPRTVIRTAIRDVLLGATSAAARVYKTRVLPLRKVELPAIAVYTLEEPVTADSINTAPRELTRQPAVTIEGWVKDTDGVDLDDALDDLALEIETAMHADPYLGGAAGESILSDTVIEVVEIGDRLLGMIALTYDVTYRTLAPDAPADEDMDDFVTVEATHDIGGAVHEDEVGVDLFTVEEAS